MPHSPKSRGTLAFAAARHPLAGAIRARTNNINEAAHTPPEVSARQAGRNQ
jgi:hypothetical protein